MILYGFYDHGNKEYELISTEYMNANYPNLCVYPSDVIKNRGINYVIGINSTISANGIASYDGKEEHDELMKFIAKYEKHHGIKLECKYIPVISGDYENYEYTEYELNEEDDDEVASLISTDSSRPSTPTNQMTKPASTNAPERPSRCRGCIEEQPNQMAHVGGCLSYDSD